MIEIWVERNDAGRADAGDIDGGSGEFVSDARFWMGPKVIEHGLNWAVLFFSSRDFLLVSVLIFFL